jgi:hypothetical protein
MTFDKVIVDIGAGAFTAGQVYVALSRCRTFENLLVINPIKLSDIMVDPNIVEFFNGLRSIKSNDNDTMKKLKEEFVKELNEYLDMQLQLGNNQAKKVTRTFERATYLAKFDDQKALSILFDQKINNPAAERTGYVGSIRKFIVLWGLLPTYRLQRKLQPPQGAGY